MKFTIAILAVFVATTQATKIGRDVYMRSLDNSEYYQTLEQLDHDKEVEQAQKQVVENEIRKKEEALRKLEELEKKEKAMHLEEERKKKEAEKAQMESEEHPQKKAAKSSPKFTIETTTFE